MEAYRNKYGTILIDDPKSKEVKVWRNFWCSFRVCLGLYLVGAITSFLVGNAMGLIGEQIEYMQKPQQPNALELFSLASILNYLGSTFGAISSAFIINWYLKSQARKRWLNKYGSR